MGDKNSGRNFPKSRGYSGSPEDESRYNTRGYYESNRRLGRSREQRPVQLDDADLYDDFYTGKRENYKGEGRISEHVHDVLLEDPYIDATDIEVKVENGEVILSGTVENRQIKRRVEDVIEGQVSGIRHFENRLHTKQPASPIANTEGNRNR